jgi:parvulin-like peptidyl-prolyl isomerase
LYYNDLKPMRMKNIRDRWRGPFGAALAAVLCFFAACAGDRGKEEGSQVIRDNPESRVILRVGDAVYTNADFLASVKSSIGEDAEDLSDEALSRLFDRFVDEKILLEAADRRNITLTEDETKAYLARHAADTDSGPPPTGPEVPEDFSSGLIVDKYVFQLLQGIEVTRSEIRAYYNEHKKDFLLAERVQVSQILYDTEEKAVGALRRLERASPEEFRLAAREESVGPEAARDGLMGIYKPGDLPSDMEKVIFSLPEGKLSQVVESSYGFHIFRVDKKLFPHLQSEEEAAPEIRLKVLDEKRKTALAKHLEELKDTLSWTVSHDDLTFSYQRLNG